MSVKGIYLPKGGCLFFFNAEVLEMADLGKVLLQPGGERRGVGESLVLVQWICSSVRIHNTGSFS